MRREYLSPTSFLQALAFCSRSIVSVIKRLAFPPITPVALALYKKHAEWMT